MACGEDAGTGRKAGTMCVHAAHVACQPAWQPGGLPSVSSSSLASKSEALSLFHSISLFPPSFSLSLSLSLSPAVYPSFFLSFRERAVLRERKDIFLFIKLQPLTWSTPTHGPPAAGWVLQQVSDYRRENARRDLKAVSRNEIFLCDAEGLTN